MSAETVPEWRNGKPYYCKTCGLGMAEYLACEDGDCELESEADAKKRRDKIDKYPPERKR